MKKLSCNFELKQKNSTLLREINKYKNIRAKTMLLNSSDNKKIHTLLEKSSDKQKENVILLECSDKNKIVILKLTSKRQYRKQRHN